MKNLFIFLCFLVFGTIFGGCGRGGGGSSDAPVVTAAPPIAPLPPTGTPASVAQFVEGSLYSTDCRVDGSEIGAITFPVTLYTYTEKNLRYLMTQLLYATDDCNSSEAVTIKEAGRVSEKSNSTDLKNLLTKKNKITDSRAITVSNTLVVAAFNQAKICGFDDWQLNQEKVIDPSSHTDNCPTINFKKK